MTLIKTRLLIFGSQPGFGRVYDNPRVICMWGIVDCEDEDTGLQVMLGNLIRFLGG